MLEALVAVSVLLWVPLLLHQMVKRGFLVLIIWLFVAPVVSNLIAGQRNPFLPLPLSTDEEQERPRANKRAQSVAYFTKEATIRIDELLEPNRLLFGVFFLLYLSLPFLQKRRFPPLDRTEIWMAIFGAILLLNVISFSFRFAYTARIAIDAFIVPFLAYFTARRLVTDEARFVVLTRVLAYLGCFLVFLGVIESIMNPIPHRVQGPFRNRDYLYVAMMVIFFMVALDALLNWIKGHEPVLPRLVHVFVLIGGPILVVLTLTRGNWLGFLAGLWTFAFLGRKLLTQRQKVAAFGLGVGLLPIIFLGVLELAQTELLSARISNFSTIERRLTTWMSVVEAGSKSPVVGIGLNNLRNFLHASTLRGETMSTPHNSYLSIFAELGAFAIFAYLAIMWSIYKTGLQIFRTERGINDRWRGLGLVAMLTAYLVPNLFTHLAYSPALLHVYLFVCAGAVAGRYGLAWSRIKESRISAKLRGPLPPLWVSGK
jgi:O-antigen ligase